MATLTLEVDEQTLERAEARSRETGVDYRLELVRRLDEFASRGANRQVDAVMRLIALADANPAYLDGGMPSREERNAR